MTGKTRARASTIAALMTALTMLCSSSAPAQAPLGGPALSAPRSRYEPLPPPPTSGEVLPPPRAGEPVPAGTRQGEFIEDVRVLGVSEAKVRELQQQIKTRPDRPFDREKVEEDVRRLIALRRYVTVDVTYANGPKGGRIITFRLVERPTLKYVKYVGNSVRDKSLEKQTNLKAGDAADAFMVTEAARKLEEYYQGKGYTDVRVTVFEGDRPGDQGAVFLISEGQKQKIWNVDFVGNEIATDARLKTQIQSRTPIAYLFKGEFDRKKVDEDVVKLTNYYRDLGFFRARIGREITVDEDKDWINLTFVIDEGPRYKVRNVQVVGNTKVTTTELMEKLKLKPGDYFDRMISNGDVQQIEDRYGSVGYIFAAVDSGLNFMEQPGELDLFYRIEEGDRYRIGRIDVRIDGDNPRTRRNTVLNRISLYPGQIADIRELRDSERRLKSSGLFLNDPAQGVSPKIVFKEPGFEDTELSNRTRRNSTRGQSPDNHSAIPTVAAIPASEPERVREVYLEFQGQLRPEINRNYDERPQVPETLPLPPANPTSFTKYRAQSPGFGTSSVVTNSTNGAWNGSPQSAAGQVPLGRTSPDSMSGRLSTTRAAPAYNQMAQAQYPQAQQYGAPAAQPYSAQPYAAQQYGAAQQYSAQPNTQPSYGPGATVPPAASFQPGSTYLPGQQYGQPVQQPGQPGQVPPPAYGAPPGYGAPAQQPGVIPRGPGVDPNDLYEPNGPFVRGDSYNDVQEPTRPIDVIANVQETQTGRIQLGVGVNSNAGLVGQLLIDEQNFDWRRVPRSWEEIRNGTAFRGGGQQFRIEAVPGTAVSRYSVVYRDPYFLDTPNSLSLSAFYFNRFYQDWIEGRLGGRIGLGRQLTPDLSGTIFFRGESIDISNPTVPTPPELADALGTNSLYSLGLEMIHDTRDSPFLATEGHYIKLGFEQTTGSFDYPRGTAEARQFFLLRQRPDRSGRHVLTLATDLGISGTHTPIYENFYAGGYSSLRGFRFRGVTPLNQNVQIGGRFMWVNSVEYMFPITADDMLRGVLFTDFGTVERSVKLKGDSFRVSVGAGLRIQIPAMGPAPIAIDIASPINNADGDYVQNVSFFIGYSR